MLFLNNPHHHSLHHNSSHHNHPHHHQEQRIHPPLPHHNNLHPHSHPHHQEQQILLPHPPQSLLPPHLPHNLLHLHPLPHQTPPLGLLLQQNLQPHLKLQCPQHCLQNEINFRGRKQRLLILQGA